MENLKTYLIGVVAMLCSANAGAYNMQNKGEVLETQKRGLEVVGKKTADVSSSKSGFKLGDVNNDRKIDVLDVTGTVAIILGNAPAHLNVKAADANGDGRVDVADISAIVSLIMKGESDAGGSGSDMPWG